MIPPDEGLERAEMNGDDDGAVRAPERSRVTEPVALQPPLSLGPWRGVAGSLVGNGITSKDPELVATILAHREAGVPPSTIGRTFGIHHSTVNRILSAADAQTT